MLLLRVWRILKRVPRWRSLTTKPGRVLPRPGPTGWRESRHQKQRCSRLPCFLVGPGCLVIVRCLPSSAGALRVQRRRGGSRRPVEDERDNCGSVLVFLSIGKRRVRVWQAHRWPSLAGFQGVPDRCRRVQARVLYSEGRRGHSGRLFPRIVPIPETGRHRAL